MAEFSEGPVLTAVDHSDLEIHAYIQPKWHCLEGGKIPLPAAETVTGGH